MKHKSEHHRARAWAKAGVVVGGAIALVVASASFVPGGDPRAAIGVYTKTLACFQAPGDASAPNSTVGLGDSITAGTGYKPMNMLAADSYFDVLACSEDSPITRVANAGVQGETTAQMLSRIDQDIIRLRPKQVIIVAGTNDVARGTGNSFENLTAMQRKIQERGIDAIFGLIPPNDTRTDATVAYNEKLRAWANSHGEELIDFFSPLADPDGTYKDGLTSDGTHPTKEAARLMANQARDFLRR